MNPLISQARLFHRLRWRLAHNAGALIVGDSKSRLVTVAVCSVLVWAALFLASHWGFERFLAANIPLGAIVASDLSIQFGLLTSVIMRQTLQQPLRHVLFLVAMMIVTTLSGWGLGIAIRAAIPWTGPTRFVAECALWLVIVALAASPLAFGQIRQRLIAAIPR